MPKGLTYEKDIQPLLSTSCTQCHGSERTRGGLRLDSLDALRQGGDGGPAVIAGNSKESHLVIAASRIDPDTAMPPQRGGRPDPMGMLAGQIMRQANPNGGNTISRDRFARPGQVMVREGRLRKTGTVTQEQFVSTVEGMLPVRPEALDRDLHQTIVETDPDGDQAGPAGGPGPNSGGPGGPPDGRGPGRPRWIWAGRAWRI